MKGVDFYIYFLELLEICGLISFMSFENASSIFFLKYLFPILFPLYGTPFINTFPLYPHSFLTTCFILNILLWSLKLCLIYCYLHILLLNFLLLIFLVQELLSCSLYNFISSKVTILIFIFTTYWKRWSLKKILHPWTLSYPKVRDFIFCYRSTTIPDF